MNDLPSGLVAFWDFKESAAPFVSETGDYSLAVERGTPSAGTGGPFGGGVVLSPLSNLYIPLAKVGDLDVAVSQAVTVIAYAKRAVVSQDLLCIAGRWDETGAARQYALFHSVPLMAGQSRSYGHVSAYGGATPGGWNYSVDGSATARRTSLASRMTMLGFTFDGATAISYIDGVADHFPNAKVTQSSPPKSMTTARNPYSYPAGLNRSSKSPFRVNAANKSGLNGRNFELGALYVFNRALTPAEMMHVHLATVPGGWPIFLNDIFSESNQTLIPGVQRGWVTWAGSNAADQSGTSSIWQINTPSGLIGAAGYIVASGPSSSPAACLYRFMGGGIPIDSVGKLSARVNHNQRNLLSRLMIEVDGSAQYVTDAVLASQNGPNTDWRASNKQEAAFSRAAAKWRDIKINTGAGGQIAGAARTADIPGSSITGIGAFTPSRSQAVRFTDFGIWPL